MKSLLIFIGGLVTGLVLILGGGYLILNNYVEGTIEYQPEWIPDFNERLFESTAELVAARTEYERWIAVGDVGLWSVDSGNLELAAAYANEALTIAEKYETDWNYGNAIHKGHLILGRIALHNRDIAEAKKQLLLAGKTPGSPQLGSFGPNMILARELLEIGEVETVLAYLDLCEKFWDFDLVKLNRWRDQVSKGESPNFGSNLIY